MNQQLEFKPTNYLTEYMFYNKFLYWLPRLGNFVCEDAKPPMTSEQTICAFRVSYEEGLRNGELRKLTRRHFNLNIKTVDIVNPKTAKGGIQKTSVMPYSIDMLEKHFTNFSKDEPIFPASAMTFWRYCKFAGQLAGLPIFELQQQKTIEGLWTHAFRKGCSKRMREYGADRELRMKKLRHAFKDAHDTYDAVDLNALIEWEDKTFNYKSAIQKQGTIPQ